MNRRRNHTTPPKLQRKGANLLRTLEVAECAEQLSIKPELLQDYAMRGCPHDKGGRGKSNRFDPAEVTAWMRENNLSGKPGRPSDTPDSPDLEKARLRKENALASKYELQVNRERQELIPAVEVKHFVVQLLGTFRNRVRGVPATVSPHLEGRDGAEREVILGTHLDECLNDLADSLGELCRGAEAA
jgi:phage terminase Nu1 subunit (DNA packaging protein)